jgi:hypothetical protein
MKIYDMTENLDLDDESLKQVSPKEAFALGIEWAIFFKRLKNKAPIRDVCLANNARRLEKLAERLGRSSRSRSTTAPKWNQIWIGKSKQASRKLV